MNPSQHKGVMLALLLIFALPAWGQIDAGTVTGRVSDSTGAVVVRAQVSIVQTEMNFETLTQTNEEGMYRAQSLRPGPYRVTITAPGFKRFVREGLDLRVGDALAVNVTLEVGAVSDSVQVTASAPLLETETSATGLAMEGQYYYTLPIYKRNVGWVLYFTPGVQFPGGPRGGGMYIDGLSGNSYFDDGQLGNPHTIMNSVEDIKVLTTTLPAEYGHSPGGAISVVKKSGTNVLHGIASMFGRTRRMQERKYFDQYRNSQVQPGFSAPLGLFFYQPDANLNGPVYIPKLYDGRNKTFFMVAWQWQIEKQSKQMVATVPNQAELNGDFTFGGIGQTIYDPRSRTQLANGNWTATPFTGNQIPISNWSKVAQKIMGMHPYRLPNVAGSLTATGPSGNIYASIFKFYREHNWSFRLTQEFTPNLKAFITGTYFQSTDHSPPYTVAINSMFDGTQTPAMPTTVTPAGGLTWVISPSFMTDIRAGMVRSYTFTQSLAYMQNYAAKLGIPNLPPDTMPQVGPSGFTEGLNVGGPSNSVSETLTFKDDTTKVYGQHAFKWGYDLMRRRSNSNSPGNPSGSFSYTSTSGLLTNGTSMPNTGNSFAGFLVGAVSSASYSRNLLSSLPRNWEHSFYVQDDWKIHPRLTLNVGLRYALEMAPSQKYGQISVFDPTAPDTSQYTNCPAGGCGLYLGAWTHPSGASPYNTQHTRFDPRFGLAWHPTEKLVIRTGFAVGYVDMGTGYLYTDELMTISTSQAMAVGDPRLLFMIDNGPPPIVYPALRADGSIPYMGNPGGHSANIISRNLHAPHTMNWNFGIQYQLQKDYMVEVRYSGSAQVASTGSYDTNSRPWGIIPNPNGNGYMNLNDPANAAYRNTWLSTTQYSRPWPGWSGISMQGNDGHMTHHEGTVRLEKRYSRGLNFTAFYTLSKTLTGGALNPYLDWGLSKSRPSYNQKHSFTGTMTYEIPIGKGRKWLNRGGWLNTLIGGFDFVWAYSIESGNPTGESISGSTALQYPSYMPTYGNVMLLRNPKLRDNWQDLGGDRFTQNNQNSTIDCGFDGSFVLNWGNSCMAARPSFTNGTDGGNGWDVQRTISANASASKEVTIWERLKFQFRIDLQNPFKWYNWSAPNTGLSINSVSNSKSFGTITPSGEAVTTYYGGSPLMNITLAFKW